MPQSHGGDNLVVELIDGPLGLRRLCAIKRTRYYCFFFLLSLFLYLWFGFG